jgi:hypothetical protein
MLLPKRQKPSNSGTYTSERQYKSIFQIPNINMVCQMVDNNEIIVIRDTHGFHYVYKDQTNSTAKFVFGKF